MRLLLAAALALSACAPAEENLDGGSQGEPGPDLASPMCTLPAGSPDGPPPIAGGTLILLADGKTAVAGDPDHDVVWIVDTSAPNPRSVALPSSPSIRWRRRSSTA